MSRPDEWVVLDGLPDDISGGPAPMAHILAAEVAAVSICGKNLIVLFKGGACWSLANTRQNRGELHAFVCSRVIVTEAEKEKESVDGDEKG